MNRIIQKRCKNCCSRANPKNKRGIRGITPNPPFPNYQFNLLSPNYTFIGE